VINLYYPGHEHCIDTFANGSWTMFSGDTQQFTRLHLVAIKNCGMDAGDTTSELIGLFAIIAGTVLAKKVTALVQSPS